MKQSINYETGERFRPDNIKNVNDFTRYAQQELGLSLPISNGRRQAWGKQLKVEMEAQDWEVADLVRAVGYIKAKKLSCKSLNGIMWYVQDSRGWSNKSNFDMADDLLHMKVARALAVETDDAWARKLSLASGRSLVLVYARWRAERYEQLHA